MKKEELFNIIGEVDEQKVAAAGMAMNTKKKSPPVWLKWGAMAACLCLVVVGVLFAHNAEPAHQIALNYNEVSSVMSGAASVDSKAITVESDIVEIAEQLGYNIYEAMPKGMKPFDFSYTTVQNKDTGEILGVIVTGREDGDSTTRPGIWVEVSFSAKPMIDYDFEYEEMVYSTINGVEVCATVVPERTRTTASGKEKTTPAVYTATFEQGEDFYYIESRGTLEQVIFDELVCSLVKAVATE